MFRAASSLSLHEVRLYTSVVPTVVEAKQAVPKGGNQPWCLSSPLHEDLRVANASLATPRFVVWHSTGDARLLRNVLTRNQGSRERFKTWSKCCHGTPPDYYTCCVCILEIMDVRIRMTT